MGGLTAPLVCERVPVELLVLVNAMVPLPGETGGEWWTVTGQGEAAAGYLQELGLPPELDDDGTYFHDVPPTWWPRPRSSRSPSPGRPFEDPWPLERWPDVPTRLVAGRDDRLFPLEFQRRLAAERLGLDVDEVPGGHLVALSRPVELADRLEAYLGRCRRPAVEVDPARSTRRAPTCQRACRQAAASCRGTPESDAATRHARRRPGRPGESPDPAASARRARLRPCPTERRRREISLSSARPAPDHGDELAAEQGYVTGLHRRLDDIRARVVSPARRRAGHHRAQPAGRRRARGHRPALHRAAGRPRRRRERAVLRPARPPRRRRPPVRRPDRAAAEDGDEEPLLVDWRAPAAQPFYTATPLHDLGVRRRRHIRTRGRTVVSIADETLDLDDPDVAAAVGPGRRVGAARGAERHAAPAG